jgi:DNA-binding transcriptional ArsR family regulator
MTDPSLGAIFFALSDPTRRRVLEVVAARRGATLSEICAAFAVSRFAIMRHLNLLEGAGFIQREALGRERRVYLSALQFETTIDNWARGLRKET